MNVRKYAIRIAVLALPLCAGALAATGASDSVLDDPADSAKAKASAPSTWSDPANTVVEVSIPRATPGVSTPERPLSANPLWAMPLKLFSSTRDRPIFLPSRRPLAPPAAAVTVAEVAVPKPREPEQPKLSLVGTIASEEDKFGIFIDQSTKNVLRLKLGEDFQGWRLQSVQSRETTFQKNQLTYVVALPQPGLSQASIAVRSDAPNGSDVVKLVPRGRSSRER